MPGILHHLPAIWIFWLNSILLRIVLQKGFFGLLHSLEDTLESSIDLLTSESLGNPHFKKRVLEEKILIYAR